MSCELKVVICGTQENIGGNEWNLPVAHKFVFNPADIVTYIAKQSSLVLFIIVFLDLGYANIDRILTELSTRSDIIAVLICNNSIDYILNYPKKLLRISSSVITDEITFRAICAYESKSQELFVSGPNDVAFILEKKANDIKDWHTTSNKVEPCHVLIIPLNTTDDQLIDFQLNMIDFFKQEYPNREFIVKTIYDFIAPKTINFNNQNTADDLGFKFRYNQTKIICDNIKKLAPIRIYLVGNKRTIENEFSALLVEDELDNGDNDKFEYVERCTFMEHESVVDEIKRDVPGYLGCKWKVTKTIPLRLDDDIKKDTKFHQACLYVYDTLPPRETKTNLNMNLCKQSVHYREYSTDHSMKFHLTGQADQVPMDQDENSSESIDTNIQYDYQQT